MSVEGDRDPQLSTDRDRQASTASENLSSRLSSQVGTAPRPSETVGHGKQLRQALQRLSMAEQVLLPLTDEASSESLDRLRATKRLLEDGLAVASASTVDARLQVLLQQHGKAMADCNEIQKKCEIEKPEIKELRRSVAEMERRVAGYRDRATPTPRSTPTPLAMLTPRNVDATAAKDTEQTPQLFGTEPEQDSQLKRQISSALSKNAQPLDDRLAAVKEAVDMRTERARAAWQALAAENETLTSQLQSAGNRFKSALMTGRRREQMQDEAAAEVGRAMRALSLLGSPDDDENDGTSMADKARQLERQAAMRPAAPWKVPSTAPTGGGLNLDPEAYQDSREKAREQADNMLQAQREVHAAEKAQVKQRIQEEETRQEQEEARFASEINHYRDHLVKRRRGVEEALAEQKAERERRVSEAQKRLNAEIKLLETQERMNQDALRREVHQAKQRLVQSAAHAQQQLELRLVKVRTACRQMLRSTGMQWDRVVVQKRQALQDSKERRVKWEKRLKFNKEAFRGHCVKTGVYARTMDAGRRRILDALVPREKVGELPC